MMKTLCYEIMYSTENETMFEDLAESGFNWKFLHFQKEYFELWFYIDEDMEDILDAIMMIYV